jgi:hypothetical protein
MKASTKSILLTKSGSINKQVSNMLKNCRFDSNKNKIYTGYYSGSGRFTTRHSAMHTVKSILNAQGYKFSEGNDSDRGGASGEFVKVSKTAFNFLLNIR